MWIIFFLLLAHRLFLCEALFGDSYENKVALDNKICRPGESEETFIAESDISCTYRCSRRWRSLFYAEGSDICSCCSEIYTSPDGNPTEEGTKYYSWVPEPTCLNYLVDGPDGVNNSQLTASSYYCEFIPCIPPGSGKPEFARLSSTGQYYGAWIAQDIPTANEYVQVDFLLAKTIAGIAVTSRYVFIPEDTITQQYAKTFKVGTSLDCQTFAIISDQDGSEKIFAGNTNDFLGVVIRYLPQRVSARCVRILPVEYNGQDMSLRFDVLGC